MRLLSALLLLCSIAWTVQASDVDATVTEALKEATESYNNRLLEAMVRGAQSPKKRGTKSTPFSEEMSKTNEINNIALNILTTRNKMDRTQAISELKKQLPSQCQEPTMTCDATIKYRSLDGTCNNVKNFLWGSANRPFNRIVDAEYANAEGDPRGGKVISTLPNPRKLTVSVHRGNDTVEEALATHMVPQFGQFLDHDISLTPEGGRSCCPIANALDADCWGITVDEDDEFYSNLPNKQTCLEFTRSTAFCFPTATTREQFNAITSYIDGSQVYGSDYKRGKILRLFRRGRLEENKNQKGFLPWTSELDPGTTNPGRTMAGDVRADDMPALGVMHSLFLQEHNRIAEYFANDTDWDDETIYQETRRIVSAELQQITYNEYLPAVLGPAAMTKYSLNTNVNFTTYDAEVDATIFNSFATAGYRFGHTMVQGLITLMMTNGTERPGYNIRDHYFNSDPIAQGGGQGYNWILAGLLTQNAQKYDGFIHTDLTDHLFKSGSQIAFGSDLAARNIQRGRDHGLPGYNKFREFCGLTEIDWDDATGIRPDALNTLRTLFTNPAANTPGFIDVYTGGLIEVPVAGALTGPTFICLMGLQFQRLKDGDRFFFTHAGQVGSFTEEQLKAIQQRTLGDIICENSDLTRTQTNVFLTQSETNAYVECSAETRKFDLSLFSSPKSSSASVLQWTSMKYSILSTITLYILYA